MAEFFTFLFVGAFLLAISLFGLIALGAVVAAFLAAIAWIIQKLQGQN